MLCLYSKTTSWKKQAETAHCLHNMSPISTTAVTKDFDFLICDTLDFQLLKTKQNKIKNHETKPGKSTNQPTTKYFPISLPGDISFTVPSPNIFQKYLIWQTEIVSPWYHVSILWIKLISPPTMQRFSKWDSKENLKSVLNRVPSLHQQQSVLQF